MILFYSKNKINTITLNYIQKLNLKIRKTSVGAQNIDNFILDIFKIVIANFQIKDKVDKHIYF